MDESFAISNEDGKRSFNEVTQEFVKNRGLDAFLASSFKRHCILRDRYAPYQSSTLSPNNKTNLLIRKTTGKRKLWKKSVCPNDILKSMQKGRIQKGRLDPSKAISQYSTCNIDYLTYLQKVYKACRKSTSTDPEYKMLVCKLGQKIMWMKIKLKLDALEEQYEHLPER